MKVLLAGGVLTYVIPGSGNAYCGSRSIFVSTQFVKTISKISPSASSCCVTGILSYFDVYMIQGQISSVSSLNKVIRRGLSRLTNLGLTIVDVLGVKAGGGGTSAGDGS